jgi:hypothetical protein
MDGLLMIDADQEIGRHKGTRGFAIEHTDGDGSGGLRVHGWDK